MKIIDAHIHYSDIQAFKDTARDLSKVDYSYEGYVKSFGDCHVVATVAMGLRENTEGAFPDNSVSNPMGCDLEVRKPDNMYTCIGINPNLLAGSDGMEELLKIEEALREPHVRGLKVYAGYYHYHVHDPVYDAIYSLAAKYKMPVVIHTGDTYSDRGLLKYAHPLHVDEIAVKHRQVNFIIAHIGDPWVMDCAEVVYKNPNVYGDLSGLIVGDRKQVERMAGQEDFVAHLRRGLVYTDNYKKYIFGTDWPLVDIEAYIEFIRSLIPEAYHEDVFYHTAKALFHI